LSDPVGDKVAFFARARELGYFLEVHFIGLSSPAVSQARVIHRVGLGGHDVPDDKLLSRYPRTLENLKRLVPVADRLTIYDNSESSRPHRPLALFQQGVLKEVSQDLPAWITFLGLPALVTPDTLLLP
jgi:predicted ABC-type ATPase